MKIMGKAHKLTSGKRIRLTSENDFEVHVQCEIDNGNTILFIAVTDTEFGVHHMIPNFCDDWKDTFTRSIPRSEWGASKGSLSTRVKTCLQAMLTKYNTSSIRKANAKVNEVQGVMKDNINLALSNMNNLDEIDSKSADVEAMSRQFHSNAKKLKCAMCAQYWKLIILGVVIVAVIITIIAVTVTQ
jgi:tetrahydromethanopterin S-methyltransferase subunit F